MSATTKPDRMGIADAGEFSNGSLVGSYFHSIEPSAEGKPAQLNWQGCIVAEPHPGFYLVELFDWIIGASSAQRLVKIDQMLDWYFYDSADWMHNSTAGAHRELTENVS